MSDVTAETTPKDKRMRFDIKTAGPAIALTLLCIIGFLLNPAFLS